MFVSSGALSSSPGNSIVPAEKLLYTAKTHTTGGREKGAARSSDGRLDVRLSMPGGPGTGTNPEQLLAAGWSACFASATTLEACRMKIALPNDLPITAEGNLNLAAMVTSFGLVPMSACRPSNLRSLRPPSRW